MMRESSKSELEFYQKKLEKKGKELQKNYTLTKARIEYESKRDILSKKSYLVMKDPLLHKTFQFYNSFVVLEMKEKESLAGMEIFGHLQEILEEHSLMIKVKTNEVKNQKMYIDSLLLEI